MASTIQQPVARACVQVFGDPHLHIDGELLALRFAPDGTLWSVEEPGVLRHWDATTGKQLEWQSLSDLETLWCFSSDARILASASNDLTFWDTSSGQVLTAVQQPSWVTAMAFHPDPAFLATGHDDGVVRLWDAAGHNLVREFHLSKKAISALTFDTAGARLAVATEDKVITIWSVEDGKNLGKLTGHTDRIPALAWHPRDDVLISIGWDTTARLWDMKRLQPVVLLNAHAGQVTALAVSPDGSLLACADSEFAVHVWSYKDRKEVHVLKEAAAEVRCLAFSSDSKRLAGNGDRIIHLWDARTGQAIAGALPRTPANTSLAVSPDGSRIVSNGGGRGVKVWRAGAAQPVLQLTENEVVHDVAWSPDGKWIAGAAGKYVRLWNAANGEPGLELEGSTDPFTSVAFSKDSSLVAAAGLTGLSVLIWRVADGEPILLIPDALDGCTVESLVFHPDGRRLVVGGIDWMATGGSDGAICLWDINERCEVATLIGGSTCLAVHPGGKRLASASLQHTICLWDLDSQQLVAELTGPEDPVTSLAYSPDGALLACGGEDRTLRLWNDDGEEVAAVELDSQIHSLAFSPDGRFIYTANGNTTCCQLEVKKLPATD